MPTFFAFLALVVAALITAPLPTYADGGSETFRFRYKAGLGGPAAVGDKDGLCEPGEAGPEDCDDICSVDEPQGTGDCPIETDDDNTVCETGETGSDCNGICEPGEEGSEDCSNGGDTEEGRPDHDPVDSLLNADFETLSQSAWKTSANGNMSTPSANETWSDKQIGGLRFASVTNASSPFQQDVTVPPELEAKGFKVTYNWLQASNTPEASGQIQAVFLNASNAEIGRLAPGARAIVPADMWIERKAEGTAPAGTKTVRMVLSADVAGAQFDNVDLRINGIRYSTINGSRGMPARMQDRLFDASTAYGANGTMGQMFATKWWRQTDGTTQMFLSSYTHPFVGTSTPRFSTTCCSGGAAEFSQMVYLGPGKGGKSFWLDWFQSGNPASVRAEFYSRYDGNLLGERKPAHVATPTEVATMSFRSTETTIPQGAEFVRITFKMDRNSAVSDISMSIGGVNWARRGLTDSSGLPTACESLTTYNGGFTDTGNGYLQYWGNSGYRVDQYDAGGNTAAKASGNGNLKQAVCVPRDLKRSFDGLYLAFNHIRTTTTTGGGSLLFDFYDSDMNLVSTGSFSATANLPGIYPEYGYVPAYGTVDAPAQSLKDISTIRIRTFKSGSHSSLSVYWTFDDIMIGTGQLALPGGHPPYDWSNVESGRVVNVRR